MGHHSFLQGDLPHSGTEPGSPALQVDTLPSQSSGKPLQLVLWIKVRLKQLYAPELSVETLLWPFCVLIFSEVDTQCLVSVFLFVCLFFHLRERQLQQQRHCDSRQLLRWRFPDFGSTISQLRLCTDSCIPLAACHSSLSEFCNGQLVTCECPAQAVSLAPLMLW